MNYAITSSLNTIAGNIPPELIAVLVEKKIWTTAQGLAYSRQVQSLSQRVQALSKLALYFPEIWSEALSAARSIGDEYYRADVLSSLAPHLPENLVPEALEAARSIGDESYRAYVLRDLAPHLPENLVPEALEAARSIGDESSRARVLSSLTANVHKMFGFFPYDFWCELIHSLASLKRRELLDKIGEHSDIIKELGSSETFREIANAVDDVGRWFP